jgi:hypothetical protein
MALDMGHATRAYKLVKRRSATESVNIFDPTDEIDAIMPFEVQRKFYREWMDSLSI